MLSGPRSYHIIGIYCKVGIALTHSLIKTVQLETTHVKDTAKESSSAYIFAQNNIIKAVSCGFGGINVELTVKFSQRL